jgi:hypothetical protein
MEYATSHFFYICNVKKSLVLMCALIFMSSEVSIGADPNLDTNDIIDRIIESDRAIQSYELYLIRKQDDGTIENFSWGFDRGREYFEGNVQTSISYDPQARVSASYKNSYEWKWAYDGDRSVTYHSYDKAKTPTELAQQGIIETLNPIERPLGFGFSGLLGWQLRQDFRQSLGETLRTLITEEPRASISVTKEVVPGTSITSYRLDVLGNRVNRNARIWIDPSRDFRPIRIEEYRSTDPDQPWDRLMYVISDVELKQIDGIWIPISGHKKVFGQTIEVAITIEIDEASIRLNKPIPLEKFSIQFPTGTRVYDGTINTFYTIGEDLPEIRDLSGISTNTELGGKSEAHGDSSTVGRVPTQAKVDDVASHRSHQAIRIVIWVTGLVILGFVAWKLNHRIATKS